MTRIVDVLRCGSSHPAPSPRLPIPSPPAATPAPAGDPWLIATFTDDGTDTVDLVIQANFALMSSHTLGVEAEPCRRPASPRSRGCFNDLTALNSSRHRILQKLAFLKNLVPRRASQ